jgi:hypothetical protein
MKKVAILVDTQKPVLEVNAEKTRYAFMSVNIMQKKVTTWT